MIRPLREEGPGFFGMYMSLKYFRLLDKTLKKQITDNLLL
ncbi:hypothetical protein M2135_000672 [Parabacteroides sp. PF5-9]|nr:hypothetical protein [Parabacteroides sp. PF5-9]